MNVMINIIKWVGSLLLICFLLAVLSGFIAAIVNTFVRIKKETAGKRAEQVGALLEAVGKLPSRVAQRLQPWQVFVIGSWYMLWLAGVVFIAYSLLPHPEMGELRSSALDSVLQVVLKSPTAVFLVQCFCCGCIGATIYGMLWLSKSEKERHTAWLLRRYILLPPLGGFLGASSYFFVKAGMIMLQVGADVKESAQGEISSFALYSIAFLSGFASRELTQKLIETAEAVFTKVPGTEPQKED